MRPADNCVSLLTARPRFCCRIGPARDACGRSIDPKPAESELREALVAEFVIEEIRQGICGQLLPSPTSTRWFNDGNLEKPQLPHSRARSQPRSTSRSAGFTK